VKLPIPPITFIDWYSARCGRPPLTRRAKTYTTYSRRHNERATRHIIAKLQRKFRGTLSISPAPRWYAQFPTVSDHLLIPLFVGPNRSCQTRTFLLFNLYGRTTQTGRILISRMGDSARVSACSLILRTDATRHQHVLEHTNAGGTSNPLLMSAARLHPTSPKVRSFSLTTARFSNLLTQVLSASPAQISTSQTSLSFNIANRLPRRPHPPHSGCQPGPLCDRFTNGRPSRTWPPPSSLVILHPEQATAVVTRHSPSRTWPPPSSLVIPLRLPT